MVRKMFRGLVIGNDGRKYTISVTETYQEALVDLEYHRLSGYQCYIQEVLNNI